MCLVISFYVSKVYDRQHTNALFQLLYETAEAQKENERIDHCHEAGKIGSSLTRMGSWPGLVARLEEPLMEGINHSTSSG